MAQHLEEPNHRSHPDLRLAWAEARNLRTVWRVYYKLPATDPRYLALDDGQIAHDLLVLRYRVHLDRMGTDKRYAAEHAAADPAVRQQVADEAARVAADREHLERMKRGIQQHREQRRTPGRSVIPGQVTAIRRRGKE